MHRLTRRAEAESRMQADVPLRLGVTGWDPLPHARLCSLSMFDGRASRILSHRMAEEKFSDTELKSDCYMSTLEKSSFTIMQPFQKLNLPRITTGCSDSTTAITCTPPRPAGLPSQVSAYSSHSLYSV